MTSSSHLDEIAERQAFRKEHLQEGIFFKNLKTFPVVKRKLRGSASAHFGLAGNRTIDAHISELPPGGHNNMHRHINEAIIHILSGRGYSIIEEDGKEPVRIDWEEGDLFSPPLNAWHQHFNADSEKPARYLAITNVPLMTAMGTFVKEQRGR
ncbi:MAG TPA: cupin domain-containing protein [Anaerolineae bacterium]|nr:cupin domain-containing protein [Anaerolineae bacterium]